MVYLNPCVYLLFAGQAVNAKRSNKPHKKRGNRISPGGARSIKVDFINSSLEFADGADLVSPPCCVNVSKPSGPIWVAAG